MTGYKYGDSAILFGLVGFIPFFLHFGLPLLGKPTPFPNSVGIIVGLVILCLLLSVVATYFAKKGFMYNINSIYADFGMVIGIFGIIDSLIPIGWFIVGIFFMMFIHF